MSFSASENVIVRHFGLSSKILLDRSIMPSVIPNTVKECLSFFKHDQEAPARAVRTVLRAKRNRTPVSRLPALGCARRITYGRVESRRNRSHYLGGQAELAEQAIVKLVAAFGSPAVMVPSAKA